MNVAFINVRRSLAPSVVLASALLAATAAQTQPPQRPPGPAAQGIPILDKHTAMWIAAVRAHAGGSFDEPAASIARWPTEDTRAVIDRTIARLKRDQARGARGAVDGDNAAVVARGLVLHTDIAIAERAGKAGTATGAADQVLVDAKPLASRWFSLHWSHAQVLADALVGGAANPSARDAGGTSSLAVARTWYRAAGAVFQRWAELGHLKTHLEDAENVLGEDPVLRLYEGTLHQAFADARLQVYRTQRRPTPVVVRGGLTLPDTTERPRPVPIKDAQAELDLAARALRRALALDASLVEGRIRLAHVLESGGQPAEAAALAREALAAPLPAFLEYYGAMVLGRAETRLGHLAEARAAFERAATRHPRSQSIHLALSQIADSPGAASEDLVRALGPDAEATGDPWWQYFRLHEPDAQALLEALRTSVP